MNEISLKEKIYIIRGKQVMLDRDLAELYGVETRYLNKAVKRNKERFLEKFCFQLTQEELQSWLFQFGTSNTSTLENNIPSSIKMGLRKLPYVFTEQGVAMLSGVLRSKKAIGVSINIMEAFVAMRHFLQENASVFQRLNRIELKQIEYDKNFNKIFNAIEQKQLTPSQGVFYDGQLYDAHTFVVDLMKSAQKEIILIDNYVSEDTLTLLSHKKSEVKVSIYTKEITQKLQLAQTKFNEQYKHLEIIKFTKSHDRFLIIDKTIYHIGASLKDLGKKWFAFSKLSDTDILEKL